jgi:hypothetical protein
MEHTIFKPRKINKRIKKLEILFNNHIIYIDHKKKEVCVNDMTLVVHCQIAITPLYKDYIIYKIKSERYFKYELWYDDIGHRYREGWTLRITDIILCP